MIYSALETWKVSKTFQVFTQYSSRILFFQGAGPRKKPCAWAQGFGKGRYDFFIGFFAMASSLISGFGRGNCPYLTGKRLISSLQITPKGVPTHHTRNKLKANSLI